MQARTSTSNVGRLREAKRQVERWRRGRQRPGRISTELWVLAAETAAEQGIEETASGLQLNVERLEGWVEQLGLVCEPAESPSSSLDTAARHRRRRKGHGRIPAAAYTGCRRMIITHPPFGPGDACPDCQDGTLYRLKQWAMNVRLVGQPPIGGTRYERERLRCGTCGTVHVAELPEEAGPDKYAAGRCAPSHRRVHDRHLVDG